jgi:hypothetical protein
MGVEVGRDGRSRSAGGQTLVDYAADKPWSASSIRLAPGRREGWPELILPPWCGTRAAWGRIRRRDKWGGGEGQGGGGWRDRGRRRRSGTEPYRDEKRLVVGNWLTGR